MNELSEQKSREIMGLLGAESLTVKSWDEIVTDNMISYPLTDLSSLGTEFSGVMLSISSIGKFAKSGRKLYEAIIPDGTHLAQKDGMSLGAVVKDGQGVVGQARFKEVGETVKAAESISNVFMAMAILTINKSLQNIADNQKKHTQFS